MRLIVVALLCSLFLFYAEGKDYLITDFGAIGNGKEICTYSIQKAIDQANKEGGGRVVVPRGTYVTGTIFVKSNVEIHLQRGAVLSGVIDIKAYKKLGKWKALLLADRANNIQLTGKGTIDGRGDQLSLMLDSLFYAGKMDSTDYNFIEKRPKYYTRPLLIHFLGCDSIQIRDINLRDAACWVQSYELCTNLTVIGITVDSDAYWNNDGLDLVDCENVRVINCDINASDDGICIKSEDWTLEHQCNNILIENCKVRSSASALKLGSSSVSHMRNITIRNIRVYDTYRSAIAIEAMQGGIVENILVENVKARNTGNAIFLRVGQIRKAKYPGTLKNITLRNINVKVPFNRPDLAYEIRGPSLPYFHNIFPASITGLKGYPIRHITLENISIRYPGRGNRAYANLPLSRIGDVPELPHAYPEFSMFGELPAWAFYVRHVQGITFKDVSFKIQKPDFRPAMVFDDVQDFNFTGLNIRGSHKETDLYIHN